jgi:hypothetical protein
MTCLRILHNKLGLKEFHLLLVLDALSVNQKSERISHSKPFLTEATEHNPADFEPAIVAHESGFFLSYPRDSVGAMSRDTISHRIKQKNDTEKHLISSF